MELRPPTARKSHPNFFAHCKRSTKMKTYKKNHPKCTKHHENANRPNGFKLWRITNKTIYFDIKTPCIRMIHVCLGKRFLSLQNASNSNVQSIASASKKCLLLVQNTCECMIHVCFGNKSTGFWFTSVSATTFCGQTVLFFKQSIKFPSWFCLSQPIHLNWAIRWVLNHGFRTRPKRGPNEVRK